jgi:hypothetical protein
MIQRQTDEAIKFQAPSKVRLWLNLNGMGALLAQGGSA